MTKRIDSQNAPDKRKTPALRFDGFHEPWETRKLGEVAPIIMGQSPDGSSYSNTPSKYILVQGNADLKDGWVTPRVWTTQVTKKAVAGDLIMSVRAPAGTMGKTAHNVILGRGVAAIRGNEFIYQILVKMDADGYWKRLSCGSTFESLNSDNINEAQLAFPSAIEQKKIGAFFQALDELITLRQRKYDKLVKVKKSMLEKLFPKNGSNVPEIRFSGFTAPWETRKANDLFFATADKNHPELPVLAATQEFGMVKREEKGINIYHDKKNEMTYKRVLPGQFVIHLRSFQGGFAHSSIEGITSPAYTVFGFKKPKKHCDYFWKYIFHSDIFIKRLETVTYGIRDGRSISYEEFLTMSFLVPSYAEQKQIAHFLGILGNLITLHQRELEKLRQIKKSFLERMFV